MEITTVEKSLIGLSPADSLPAGGITYQIYTFTGHGHDSSEGWVDSPFSVKTTLRNTFGMEFCKGSLNVRLVEGIPWILPEKLNPQRINLGVIWLTYVLPVVLNEMCIGILGALNVRGFDYTTGEPIEPIQLNDKTEAYHIYSPVHIRERLGLTDIENSNEVIINARLLPGELLTIHPTRSWHRLSI